MSTFLQDVRFGLRLLRRQPGFSAIAVVVLALGIGVNTSAFSILNTLLLKPRTGHVDAELAGLYSRHRTRADAYRSFSWAEFAALRERTDLFRSLSAHGMGLLGLREGDATRRVFADIISANFFETFGVRPVLGRAFSREEEAPGADIPVVILSYGLWARMGGSPDVLGQTLTLNTRPFTVVGVAPRGFGGSMVMVTPEVWVPTGVYDSVTFDDRNEGQAVQLASPDYRGLIVVARLAPGATIASLAPGLDVVSRQMSEADPAGSADYELELAPLSRLSVSTRPQTDDELTSFMSVLLGLAAVVLLIASFNLANMVLARGRARSREFAIRSAIGGSRRRLVRQLLTEHLVLAGLGGAAGLGLSSLALRFLLVQMPAAMPISVAVDTTPDARVLGATAVFAALAVLMFGLGPAWRFARLDPMRELRDQTGDASSRTWLRWFSTRDALMTAQLALTFVMLTAAGLFVRGSMQAARTDPGFTLDRGLIANLDTTFVNDTPEQSRDFYARALDGLRALPGVTSAGLASHLPFGEFESATNVQRPGPPLHADAPGAADGLVSATIASVSRDYFATMGIALVAGRDFTAAESASPGGEPVAIIDETLARKLFGTTNAVGELIQSSPRTEGAAPPVLRVVGVVGGVRSDLFMREPGAFLYFPFGQQPTSNAYLHARTNAPSADAETAMLPGVRAMLAGLAARPPIVALETRPMFRERNLLLAVVRTGAAIFVAFGVAALFLAAVGVYGVKAYLVARRTREIGVRIALGAEPRDVVWMVLREGLVLVSVGLVIGAGLSVLTGLGMRAVTFQGQAFDLVVVAAAAVTLLAAMLLASWIPARRATRVAPTQALRA
ncbi:MAG: ADOP family duplicated permease [Vicinamibacterales bacterium]